jgi:AcrR family transcriptional regulator
VARRAAAAQPQAEPGRRERILAAALEVFARRGYAGATIKRIATAAGLRSPALLYWYFPDKAALFRAVAMEHAQLPHRLAALDLSIDLPVEIFLERFARAFLDFFADDSIVRLIRLVMLERDLVDATGFSIERDLPNNVFVFLDAYFQAKIADGTLRDFDVRAAVQSFLSQLWVQVGAKSFFPGIGPEVQPDGVFLPAMIDLFVKGIRRVG